MNDRTGPPAHGSLRDRVAENSGPVARRQVEGGQKPKSSHLFVDNVRFWSMFAVVALHSTQIFDQIGHSRPFLSEVIETPFKFGTIAFFLMSGFLAGNGLETVHPLQYLGKRIRRIFLPWACWILAMIAGLLATDFAHHRIAFGFTHKFFGDVGNRALYSLTDTAFWFVPNLLLCLAILLLFQRVHGSLRFGAVLFALSFFYAVNLYAAWIPSAHTEALLGFVFYLWLGAYAARHKAGFDRWVERIPLAVMFIAAVATGLLAYGEAQSLHRWIVADAMNSLRLSNQIFSVAAVLFIYKFSMATWPRFIDVRKNTFGIYLIHPLMLLTLFPFIKSRPVTQVAHRLVASHGGAVVLWAAVTLSTYGLALLLTKFLVSQAGLGWLVGVPRAEARRPRPEGLASSTAEIIGSGAVSAD